MAIDITAIGIGVETAKVKAGARDLDNFGRSANKAAGGADQSTKSMGAMSVAAGRLIAVVGVAGLGRALISTIDSYTKFNAQLKIASRNQEDFAKSYQDVIRISQSAQGSIGATATLYSRLANTLKDTNVTQQQFANITESVALGLRVSGATQAEASSAMLQLSQAFAAGVLRGEEFNAVSEASFPLMKALADSMAIPIESLRSMAMDGKITRTELVKAFADPALIDTFRAQSKEMNTVSGALQTVKNSLTIAIGEFDKGSSFGKVLALTIRDIATALDAVVAASARQPFNFVEKLLPAYKGYRQAVEKENAELEKSFNGKESLIIPSGMKLGDIVQKDIGAIGQVSDEFKKLQATAATIRTENPLKDIVAVAENYKTQLAQINDIERVGLVTTQEAARYRAQFNAEYERTLSIKNKDKDAIAEARLEANKELSSLQSVNALLLEGVDLETARFKVQSLRQGLMPAQIDALLKEQSIQADILEIEESKKARIQEWIKVQQKAYDDGLKSIEDAKDAALKANEKVADEYLRGIKEQNDKAQREYDRMADSLSRSITDALFRGFESGKSFLQNFKDTLIRTFQTLILQPQIEMIVRSSGVAGIFGSGNALASTGTGAGGFGGIIDTVRGGFNSLNNSVTGSIEKLGAFLSNGNGGLGDRLGGFLGQYSNQIATGLAFAPAAISLLRGDVKQAAFQGAGAGIGFAIGGPVGAGIGSFIGGAVGGLFGGKAQPPRSDGQGIASINNGVLTSSLGIGARGRSYNEGTAQGAQSASVAFAQTLSGVLKTFGGAGNVSANTRYGGRDGGSGYGNFSANFDGRGFTAAQTKYSGAYGEETLKQYLQMVVNEYLKQAIQQSNISANFKGVFSRANGAQEISAISGAAGALIANNAQLVKAYGASSETIAWHANVMGQSTETFLQYTNAVINAANSTKTIGRALLDAEASLNKVYGGAIPATIEQFDARMKALAGNPQGFANLLGIRDQFVAFTQSINGLKGNVNGAIFPFLSAGEQQAQMQADLAKLFGELNMAVPGSIQELIALGQSIDYTTEQGLNLAAAFPSLMQAFQQTKGVVDSLVSSLNPNRFRTFFDFAVASSYQRQGIPLSELPAANMPSYAVGTPYVPQTGPAMIHQGERIIPARQNASLSSDSTQMVSLLSSLVSKVSALEYDLKRAADGSQRSASELEDIASGDVTIQTQAA